MLPTNYPPFHPVHTSTIIPNSTFNSTNDSGDPIAILLNKINSDELGEYALIAVCIVVFIVYILPLLGIILFATLNYGGLLVAYYFLKIKNGQKGINEEAFVRASCKWWYWLSKIWFGYEMIGFENCPPDERIMFISLHGVFPAPLGSAYGHVAKYRGHAPYGIVDKNHANHPIFKNIYRMINFGAWSREECVKVLQEGNDLVIMPGGVLELKYSDSNYNVVWGNRKGFAQVAREANAVIVPLFTVNLNEAFWIPFLFKQFIRSRFAPKQFAFAVGGLPVKLTSVLGKPIRCDKSKSAEDIFNETYNEIQRLIATYQRVPGNKFYALLDRFRKIKAKTNTNV